jgi:hypothetical protein
MQERPGLADHYNGSGDRNRFGELGALCGPELKTCSALSPALQVSRHHPAPVFPIAAAASRELCRGWGSQQRRHHAEADEEYLEC